ncbi:MAG TPA: fused MFS/spermidine synthase [Candidatus Polarisedimenticolaceae bacterium]|nr:fused MFS/spermidine synthase [Candidatus Polarisedimenticolaceae bacterium]
MAGFALMTLELVSSRVVDPIAGSSLFAWTSIIGVTLLGLAFGAYWGGRTIDNDPRIIRIVRASSGAAFLVAAVPLLATAGRPIMGAPLPIELCSTALVFYLFFAPSMLLGMLLPMLLKLAPKHERGLGVAYGSLSMFWSFGSIVGVFGTGFVFISVLGSRGTLYGIATTLLVNSFWFHFASPDRGTRSERVFLWGTMFGTVLIGFSSSLLLQP